MKPHRLVLIPLLIPAAVVAAVACGGATSSGADAPTGSASVSGSVAGATFTPASQVALFGYANGDTECGSEPDGAPYCDSTRTGQAVSVLIVNQAAFTCSLLQAYASSLDGPNFANVAAVEIDVRNASGALVPGTYSVVAAPTSFGPNPTGVTAWFETTTSTCASAIADNATTGTVTFTQVGPSGASGTYDLTFGAQGTVSGSFDVPVCELPDAGPTSALTVDAAEPPCMP